MAGGKVVGVGAPGTGRRPPPASSPARRPGRSACAARHTPAATACAAHCRCPRAAAASPPSRPPCLHPCPVHAKDAGKLVDIRALCAAPRLNCSPRCGSPSSSIRSTQLGTASRQHAMRPASSGSQPQAHLDDVLQGVAALLAALERRAHAGRQLGGLRQHQQPCRRDAHHLQSTSASGSAPHCWL